MVQAALSQKSAKDGREYVAWYNEVSGRKISLDSPWCAIFVSWCANRAGIGPEEMPVQASCTAARNWFKKQNKWQERGYTPRRGDLILFDWNGDPAAAEHIGIVTGVDGEKVCTVEGNAGVPGKVREKTYPRTSRYILGYGAWQEKEEKDLTQEETQALIDKELKKANAEAARTLENVRKEVQEKLDGKADREKVYRKAEDVPEWGRPTVEALMDAGRLLGNEKGELNLSRDLLRALVIMERGETVCR